MPVGPPRSSLQSSMPSIIDAISETQHNNTNDNSAADGSDLPQRCFVVLRLRFSLPFFAECLNTLGIRPISVHHCPEVHPRPARQNQRTLCMTQHDPAPCFRQRPYTQLRTRHGTPCKPDTAADRTTQTWRATSRLCWQFRRGVRGVLRSRALALHHPRWPTLFCVRASSPSVGRDAAGRVRVGVVGGAVGVSEIREFFVDGVRVEK
eukprot:1160670-Rhodomonas_salina.1